MERLLALAGGQPLKADDWALIQDAARDSVSGLVKGLSGITTPCIVAGLEITFPDDKINITAGILFDGEELCYVPAAEFTYMESVPDGMGGGTAYSIYFVKNETSSESRIFKDDESRNVYRNREYTMVYQESQPAGSIALPQRMMDLVASYVAPLVPVPSQTVTYKKKSFQASWLENFQEIIPAPGAGKTIQVISLVAHIAPVSPINAGTAVLRIFYGTDVEEETICEIPNAFIELAGNKTNYFTPNQYLIPNMPMSIMFYGLEGAITGSALINIHVVYKIITL